MLELNTFSITARCERTGQFGIAVSTKVPAVGALCPYVKAGVGAVASQSFVNPYIGINGLKYLGEGLTAKAVKERILSEDPQPEIRQFAIVDKEGQSAAYTGEKCVGWHGHNEGDGFVAAGNMLVGEETIKEMARIFEATSELKLSERLLQALEAGQAAGGDKRGKQSAALKVVSTESYPLVDLRVDEHKDPVTELRRVYEVAKYELFPFIETLPTKENPLGQMDLATQKELGLLD